MIIDKIGKYLTDNNLTLNDTIRYEIEKLAGVAFKRQFMEIKEEASKGKLRLSGCGSCARKLAYGYHGIEKKGKELDARSKIVFFQGDLVELMLVSIAKLAGCNLLATGLNQIKVTLKVNGNSIEGHPDGLLLENQELYLVEFKSMSSFGFKRFQNKEIDEGYLAQVNCYLEALGLKKCVFVGLNKDAGVLHEMILEKDEQMVKFCKNNILSVLNSTLEKLPLPAYEKDTKGYYPWQCLYCPWWILCKPNAGKVLVGSSYKLKEKMIKEKNGHRQNIKRSTK
jgi:hypothetical protein